MATFQEYTPGLGSVGNYQVSGTPWITGSLLPASGALDVVGLNDSTHRVQFPYVTKEVTVVNRGAGNILVHLANDLGAFGNANGGHVFLLPPSGAHHGAPLSRQTFDMKTKEMYISNAVAQQGSFQLYASLTRIDTKRMFELTGSGINNMPGDTSIIP